MVFTSGIDGRVISWRLPPLKQDPYEEFGKCTYFKKSMYKHDDAVWSLCVHPQYSILFSAGADAKVSAWKFEEDEEDNALRYSFTHVDKSSNTVIPSALCMLANDPTKLLVGYVSGELGVVDVETGKIVSILQPNDAGEFNESSGGTGAVWATNTAGSSKHITAVASHPNNSLALTANIDQCVRFFDIKKNGCVDVLRAHRDAVTSVSVEPSGQFMVSSSHDQSVRFWDLNTKKIMQDLDPHQTHAKKFDESVHSVVYHATLPILASGGADSVIKIYT